MAGVTPVRLIRNEFELQDLVDSLGRDSALVEQDFAVMTIAAGLVAEYGTRSASRAGSSCATSTGTSGSRRTSTRPGSTRRRTSST